MCYGIDHKERCKGCKYYLDCEHWSGICAKGHAMKFEFWDSKVVDPEAGMVSQRICGDYVPDALVSFKAYKWDDSEKEYCLVKEVNFDDVTTTSSPPAPVNMAPRAMIKTDHERILRYIVQQVKEEKYGR